MPVPQTMPYRMSSDSSMPPGDGDSNYESVLEASHDEYWSRCLWYGEHFFRCVLAEGLFANASESARGEDLRSRYMQAIIGFPYTDCIEYVDGIKAIELPGTISTGNKPFALFMTKIGALLDQGDGEARQKLAVMIQNRGGTGDSILRDDKRMPPSAPNAEELAKDKDAQIAMYTMKLNEWCQRKGKSLDFDDKHLSVDPPLWEVKLKVEGFEFSGKGKKRKSAQHIASMKACNQLKIDM